MTGRSDLAGGSKPVRRPGVGADKETWRAWAGAAWERVDAEKLSAAVAEHLTLFAPLVEAGTLALYFPMSHELDITRLAAERHGAMLVAATRTPEAGPLTLHPLGKWPLERHPYGFLQPQADTPQLDPAVIDVALVPGLCFARDGTRLGHGAGYFDEFLTRLRPDALRIGVTPARLVVDRLPRLAHDVPMSHLATEVGVSAAD